MNQKEALMFLAHLGDAATQRPPETCRKINEIQKEVGIHESCQGSGKMKRELIKCEYEHE